MTDYKVEIPENPKLIDFNGGEYPINDDGNYIRITTGVDDITGAPWDEYDGHGVVTDWTTEEPEENDIILNSDRGRRRIYKYNESLEIAKRDGWRDPKNSDMSPDKAAEIAVKEDAERLRSWCNDEWTFETIIVELCNEDGEVLERNSLAGIESDSDSEYKAFVVSDLTADLMTGYPEIRAEQINNLKSSEHEM